MNKVMRVGGRLAFLLATFCVSYGVRAVAQEPPPPATKATRQQTLRRIADKLTEESGIPILVTSALTPQLAAVPETTASADNLEGILDTLLRRMPDTIWAKVYLPPNTQGRRYSGDAAAQFVQGQNGLFGRLNSRPAKPEPGMVELLGKKMTLAEAQPYLKGLGLQPHYVLMSRRVAMGAMTGGIGGAGGADPILQALCQQLGVTNQKEIPSGEYDVTVPGNDGTPMKAHVIVEQADGRSSIRVRFEGSALPPK